MGHQDNGTPWHWDTKTLGHGDTGTLGNRTLDTGTIDRVELPNYRNRVVIFVELQALGLGLGVDFTFAWDDNNNNDNNNDKNPHLNFWKGITLGDKEQGVGIRDKG